VTGYTVTRNPGAATQTVTGTSLSISGLSNGTSYSFTVSAVNSVGSGPGSTSNSVTPSAPPPTATTPGAPQSVASSAGDAGVSLSWGAPVSHGGSAVTGYRVTVLPGGAVRLVSGLSTSFTGLSNGTLYTFKVAALNAVGAGPEASVSATPLGSLPPVPASPPPSLAPLVPGRLLESRPGASTVDGVSQGVGVRPAGSVTELQVTGRHGVPADASAAVLNVTVTGAQGDGFVTVWPCGTTMPNASSLNFTSGQTIPNAVITKIGAGGKVCLFTTAATYLLADINGYETA
jgi:Fibronectin type III domain